jgi:predicted nucleic acid-binding Zn ribbon protein
MMSVVLKAWLTHRQIRTSQLLLTKRERLSKHYYVRMEKIKNFQRKTMAISIKMKFMLLISKVNITDI